MTRVRAVTLTSVVLILGGGAATFVADAGARHRIPCGPAGAHTLARSSRARVYASHGAAFGCAAGGATTYRLGVTTSCTGGPLVGRAVVAGEIAAYASERCGVDTGVTQVLVRNLRSGQRLSASAAVTSPGPESFGSVRALVARPNGAAAWVASATSIGTRRTNIELRRVDSSGSLTVLDSGPAVAAPSLRLSGNLLSWRHGGQHRLARLT